MPGRAELAAAADIREHEDAAALEPRLTAAAKVRRGHRQLEAAVTVLQNRVLPVERHAFLVHDEVGHLRAVLARGEPLLGGKGARVEARRALLREREAFPRDERVSEKDRARGEEVGIGHHEAVPETLGRGDGGRARISRELDRGAHPSRVRLAGGIEAAVHVVEHAEQEGVLGDRDGLEEGGSRGREDRLGAREGIGRAEGAQGQSHEAAAGELAGADHELVAEEVENASREDTLELGALGEGDTGQAAVRPSGSSPGSCRR